MKVSGWLAGERRIWRSNLSALCIIFFLSPLLSACSKPDKSNSIPMSALPPPAVDVYKVPLPQSIPVELEYPARTKSSSSVTVVARVAGTLQKQSFREGEAIRSGETLFRIEPDVYLAEKAHASAQLEQATALLHKAQKDRQRTQALYEQQVANEQDRDAVHSAYETALAAVAAAQARLQQATINLAYTDVKAAADGIAGLKLVDVGNLVTPGMPLVTLTQLDPIYVEFSLPDLEALNTKYELQSGSWAKISGQLRARLRTDKGLYRRSGLVDFLDANVDVKTSSVKSRAIFANPEGELLPGQFIRITLEGLRRKQVLMIPQQAVILNPGGAIVFVLEGGKAAVRPVVIGDSNGDNFIVEKGVKPGDLVIVNNFFKIKPGSPVRLDKIINHGI